MDSLPFHLLEEILFKLDRKSLAMMQCTEKSINSHVSDDPYFKPEYLSRFRLMDHSESKLVREIVCGSGTESELECDEINQSDGTTAQVFETVRLSSEMVKETKEEGCFDGVVGDFSSAMEVDEKVDEVMTMAGHDKRVSSLSTIIMRLIHEVSPNVRSLLKRKETQLGKRLLIEEGEGKKLKRKVCSGSKFLNVESINKRIRVK
ncbi:unnamed protein product [Microthlaspi erraticum]|uniref:F-box domain-containing protein n=1 Tax=Microthlaspi erraticum TaxID=1685480 RepID=A0A6D2I3Y5_9BRAS|nr:unnamed protein product [Microthlaspi erraticum]CAA7024292.1 unnamed protein product [Microthlaspi erraticum]